MCASSDDGAGGRAVVVVVSAIVWRPARVGVSFDAALAVLGVSESKVAGVVEVLQRVFECLPVFWTWVVGYSRERVDGVLHIAPVHSREPQEVSNCLSVRFVLHVGAVCVSVGSVGWRVSV